MRNLKRALSLILVAIMLIGMTVISAFAVSYNGLTDKDQIVDRDVVPMLVFLGITEGKPNGSYVPTENVDCARMVKMLSIIMNKGVDSSTLYQSVNFGPTDITSSQAKGRINYCYTVDIIADRGNGTLDLSATVTALEAAETLLVVMGHDPEIEGFEGANRAINVPIHADGQGILEGFTKDLSAPLNRDDAALLIYNALNVEIIQSYTTNNHPIIYSDYHTILSDKCGAIKVEGVVTANEWATLNDDTDAALQEGKTRVYNPDGILSTTGNTAVAQGSNANVETQIFNVNTPVDTLGKAVTMCVKKTIILADSTVYGAPMASDVNTVIETDEKITDGDSKDNDSLVALLKGTGLATDKTTEYYHNYKEVTIDSVDVDDIMNVRGATLTVVDNDNGGYVSCIIFVEKSLTHVSGVSSKSETTTLYGLSGDDAIDSENIVTTVVDLTKGDVVLVAQYDGRTYVGKSKTVTGGMELFNVKNKDDNKNYIKVGGEKYRRNGLEVLSSINKDNPVKFLIPEYDDKVNGVQFDVQYSFFLDDFGNIVAFREIESAPTQYALALDSAYPINGLTTISQIKLLLVDGTSKVHSMDMNATADRFEDLANPDDNSAKDSTVETWFGSAITDDNSMDVALKFIGFNNTAVAGTKTRGYASGNLVVYTIDDDEVVIFGPAELDNGVIVDDTSRDYIKGDNYTESEKSTFSHSSQTELKADTARGDVDLRLENNSVDIHTNSYGIDEETTTYYYNGPGDYAAAGYDNMVEMIDADKAGGIDNGKIHISVVTFDDATDMAEVIVLCTNQAKFSTDAYVCAMSVHDKFGSMYTYSVIDEEGSVPQIQSETRGAAGKLCTYTADGDCRVLEARADCVSNSNKTAAADAASDVDLIVTTHTRYSKVYDFDRATDLMSDDETMKQSLVSGVSDNSSTDWERCAGKAPIIDVENTEVGDKTAVTTELTPGQYGIVVYNDDSQTEVVYVTNTCKMEADVNTGDDDSKGDMIESATVSGKGIGESTGYKTIRAAVENAKEIQVFTDAIQNYALNVYTKNAASGGAPCYGTAVVYGEEDTALNANLGSINQPTSSGAIIIQNTTSNGIRSVALGTYMVFATSSNGDVTYYVLTFVK